MGAIWLRNSWQVAALSREVGAGMLKRRICGINLILYRTESGAIAALADRCAHRLAPLSLGRRVGDEIVCPYHGMQYGPDGICTKIPGQSIIPSAARVDSFPCHERYNLVWIWMGERSLADPALIPDLHWAESPDWTAMAGYLHFACDYRLSTDNLMDLSHESYLHQRTIGNVDEEPIADFPVQVSVEHDRLVRAHREMPDIVSPPMFSAVLGGETRIHRWQSAIYMPPGIHMTNVGFHPVDTPRSEALMHMVLHLLTPESATSTHYFWVFCRNYHRTDEEVSRQIELGTINTLQEDADLLLEQQAVLDADPQAAVPLVAIGLDDAPLKARRLLMRLVRAEHIDRLAIARPVPLAPDGPLSSSGGRLAA